MDTSTVGASSGVSTTIPSNNNAFNQIKSEDFLKLLIQQLQFQDPLKPMSNEELVGQISQIRTMEMNSSLTTALDTLTKQQQFGLSASLIGKYVESAPASEDEAPIRGTVSSIEYRDGEQILRLDNGAEMPISKLGAVTTLDQLARDIVGITVQGAVPNGNGEPVPFQGTVKSARIADGQLLLTLDNGQEVPFRYVLSTV